METLSQITAKFKNLKVMVVGDLILDEYIWGRVDRISREAPIPVLDVEKISHRPGGAANAAYNAKVLGSGVFLVGVIGPDHDGKILRKTLEKRKIDNSLVVDPSRRTTRKTRAMARTQQLVCLGMENRRAISPEIESQILKIVEERIKDFNAVIISDYGRGMATHSLCQSIINLAKANNVLCYVDPTGNDYSRFQNCCGIKPNEEELAYALNMPVQSIDTEEKFIQAGQSLYSQLNLNNLIISRGGKGMTLFFKEGTFSVPALNKEAVDVSGAGDTAIVTFALAQAAGADPKGALIAASHACAIVVGKMGTAVVSPFELEKSLKVNHAIKLG